MITTMEHLYVPRTKNFYNYEYDRPNPVPLQHRTFKSIFNVLLIPLIHFTKGNKICSKNATHFEKLGTRS